MTNFLGEELVPNVFNNNEVDKNVIKIREGIIFQIQIVVPNFHRAVHSLRNLKIDSEIDIGGKQQLVVFKGNQKTKLIAIISSLGI